MLYVNWISIKMTTGDKGLLFRVTWFLSGRARTQTLGFLAPEPMLCVPRLNLHTQNIHHVALCLDSASMPRTLGLTGFAVGAWLSILTSALELFLKFVVFILKHVDAWGFMQIARDFACRDSLNGIQMVSVHICFPKICCLILLSYLLIHRLFFSPLADFGTGSHLAWIFQSLPQGVKPLSGLPYKEIIEEFLAPEWEFVNTKTKRALVRIINGAEPYFMLVTKRIGLDGWVYREAYREGRSARLFELKNEVRLFWQKVSLVWFIDLTRTG